MDFLSEMKKKRINSKQLLLFINKYKIIIIENTINSDDERNTGIIVLYSFHNKYSYKTKSTHDHRRHHVLG